jgi:hypothetical protein
MKVDATDQPYIETDCGRSYLVDGLGNYEALQEQYAQASKALGDHPVTQIVGQVVALELDPTLGASETSQGSNPPLEDALDKSSVPQLESIRELMSSEDYAATVASILAPEESEASAGFNELDRRLDPIPEWDEQHNPPRPSRMTPPRCPRGPSGRRTWGKTHRSSAPGLRGWRDSLSRGVSLQMENHPSIFFDYIVDLEGGKRPPSFVGLIQSGEEGPGAIPWSTGPPREEPDGHEWQFYDPAHTGSPWTFHTEGFRKALGPSPKVQFVCTKWLNLQGFFDTAGHLRNLPIYEFMVRLGSDGKEYPVRSHELPNGACGISTMLVGRGTIIRHRWGMKVDAADQPYIKTDCGRSYLVDGMGNYEALQEQYAQASKALGDRPVT